jgi:hypothetical protein
MAKEPGKRPITSVPVEPEILEYQIRERAYELYQERGNEDGHDVEDWLRAEAELKSSKPRSAGP